MHEVGCARDKAHNRTLFFDQYCCLVMLFLFNPIVSSLRAMQQASELKKVQRLLGCPRASLGSLSESTAVFDPSLLHEIVAELGELLSPIASDPRLDEVKYVVTLVDGTLLKALPRIAEACWFARRSGNEHHSWRLHTHFVLSKYVPKRIDLSNGRNSGEADERSVLRQTLEPDHCYVMDRGYAKFALFNAINAKKSSYVCRLRDNSIFEVIEERQLSEEALEANVVRDCIVNLGVPRRDDAAPDHAIRLVCVQATPHAKRKGGKGNRDVHPSDGVIRIATNLLDVPAEIVALLYRYRYTIELFFRFFKHILGCRHLIADDRNGIEIQTYCAIIACMLISLYTGRKPTLRTYEMVCYYFMGMADEEELLAHITKLQPQG